MQARAPAAQPLRVASRTRSSFQVSSERCTRVAAQEGVSRAGGVHDLDHVEGGHLAAELPGGVEGAVRPLLMRTRETPRSRSSPAASSMSSVPSRGESSSSPSLTMVERSRSGSTASLAASALSQRCSRKLTSKATGTSSSSGELGDAVRRGADGLAYQGDAAEVDERSPRDQILGDVFGREQLVGGRAGAVEGELAVAVGRRSPRRPARCGWAGCWRPTPEVSTPSDSSARRMKSPKRSSPTLPTKAASEPSLEAATATFAGAPPGLATNPSSTSESSSPL